MPLIIRDNIDYSVQAQLDKQNRRIWVSQYKTSNPVSLQNFLIALAREHGLQKIILPVKTRDLDNFSQDLFRKEGTIDGYFHGSSGHFLSAFPDPARANSLALDSEQKAIKEILASPQTFQCSLPAGYTLRRAGRRDASSLADLFSEVFSSYPTPVYDPLYLARSISGGDLFLVIYQGQRLAAVAAAEINWDYKRAELTNCATHPDFRGLGLNTLLLKELEKRCLSNKITCLYSLARASSYGMNLVLHRLGYTFRGTMINNCHIGGGYEDMNIWVRQNATLGDGSVLSHSACSICSIKD